MFKCMKRIIAIFLTLILAAGMMTAVQASPPQPPDPDGIGSITVVPYIIDASVAPSDPKGTAESNPRDEPGHTPMKAGSVTLIKVIPKSDKKQGSVDPDDYNDVDNTGVTKELADNIGSGVVFTDLSMGYYKISHSTDLFKSFIVSLPSVNPEGEITWLWDVFSYPKQSADVEVTKSLLGKDGKKIAQNEYPNTGKSISWVISAEIPVDIAGYSLFQIKDNLDVRLTADSVTKVYYTDTNGAETELSATGTDPGYKVNDFDLDSQTLEVDFIPEATENFTNQLAGALGGGGTEKPKVHVEFKANIKDDADGDELKNTGVLVYKKEPGDTPKEIEHTPKTNEPTDTGVYTVKLRKQGSDGQALANARFRLYDNEADALDQNNQNYILERNSAADGALTFDSMVAGVYYLKEVQAPEGYMPMLNPIKLELTGDTYDYTAVLVNQVKPWLPVTGQRTALIITMIGLLLILGGSVTYLVLRRKRRYN